MSIDARAYPIQVVGFVYVKTHSSGCQNKHVVAILYFSMLRRVLSLIEVLEGVVVVLERGRHLALLGGQELWNVRVNLHYVLFMGYICVGVGGE